MRDEDDFSAYAVARWPSLVRVLVLLGTPPEEAPALAYAALGRLRTDWRHRDELGDLDEHTALTLLHDLPPRDPTSAHRQAEVLWSLLGVGAPAAPVDEEEVRRAAESVAVEPLDLERVVVVERAQRRTRRRRTTRVVAVMLAVLAVVAGGWAWWATRPGPPPGLPDVPVERVDNPIAVGWYAGDTLQLDRVALAIDDLESFAQVRQGAVYADHAGEVILVDTDGVRTRLGTQAKGGAFAVSDEDGLAAWVDVRGAPELHVYDLAAREDVATLEVDESLRVLAIDEGVVYVAGDEGAFAFERNDGWTALARVSPDGLLDVAGQASVFQTDPQTLLVTHGDPEGGVVLPGVGAQLSPEGDYVLSRDGGARGRVWIFDTITGEEVDTGLVPGAEVAAAKLGGHGLATYLVEQEHFHPEDQLRVSSSGSLELVTCPLVDPALFTTCTVHRTFPRAGTWALAQ